MSDDLSRPMTPADWLRVYAGWVETKQFDMLDAENLLEWADRIEALEAEVEHLNERAVVHWIDRAQAAEAVADRLANAVKCQSTMATWGGIKKALAAYDAWKEEG